MAALLTVVTAALALLAAPAASQAIPNWSRPGDKIKICTSEYTPMVYCVDRTPEQYGGFEIELFRAVAAELGWTPDMLEWSCLDWDEMLGHLEANDGVCDIAVAGIDVNYKSVETGVVFTWPTYRNGLAVLTTGEEAPSYGMFSFFNAFEWDVWVVTVATMIVVPFIVYGLDWLAYRGKWPKGVSEEDTAFSSYFWQSISRPMWMRNQMAVSWAANLVVTIYAFLILILFALYIGYATSNLTTSLLDSQITGVDTLPGKAVGAWTEYVDNLQKYGVAAAGLPWDSAEDEAAMVRKLKTGSVKALVLDASFLNYLSASDCGLTVVGSTFDTYQQATAFPAGFSDAALLDKYNAALANLTASGVVEALAAQELVPADAPECPSGEISSAITFYQVSGLWILLAGAVGVGLVLVMAHILHVRYTRPALSKSAAGAKQLVKSATRRGQQVVA